LQYEKGLLKQALLAVKALLMQHFIYCLASATVLALEGLRILIV